MRIETATTEGIKISVTTRYKSNISNSANALYYFYYQVEIENKNNFPVQLISRYWRIFDLLKPIRIVEGEGVIGEQPKLEPGEQYQYTSGCDLSSEIGCMDGHYHFVNLETGAFLKVKIPKFQFFFPGRLN
jgi:ApaG protein